jgi:hypothetical protein
MPASAIFAALEVVSREAILETTLEKTLSAWLANGGKLEFLTGDDGVRTEAEARLVCAVLEKALSVPVASYVESGYNLHAAIAYFQNVQSQQAANQLRGQGLPRLRSLVRDYLAQHHMDVDIVLFAAKILALYGDPEDVPLLVSLARDPACENAYLWEIVLSEVATAGNEAAVRVAEGLRQPLPGRFCRVAFLDFSNKIALAGTLAGHPFSSAEGIAFLKECLSEPDESKWSYAVSATAALPFLQCDSVAELVAIARAHPSLEVQIEAAWADARMGQDAGVERLALLAGDPRSAHRAIRYLDELGRADRIPGQALTPEAQALAEMAHWLSHPSELGRPPAEVSVADAREIFWPPTDDTRKLYVIRYTYPAEGGKLAASYGLVGSTTWSMMSEDVSDPQDVYALHCCWELQMKGDARAPAERSAAAGRRILAERNPEFAAH